MLSNISALRRYSTRGAVAALTMLLLGCGTMANVASTDAARAQNQQEATQSTNLDEAQHLNQEVVSLYSAGRYDEAIPLADRALGISEKVLGPEHINVANSLHTLAELYRAQGNYTKAQ